MVGFEGLVKLAGLALMVRDSARNLKISRRAGFNWAVRGFMALFGYLVIWLICYFIDLLRFG